MKSHYTATYDGESKEVTLEARRDGSYRVCVGETELEIDVQVVGDRAYQLVSGGEVHDLVVSGAGPEVTIYERGSETAVQLLDEQQLARRAHLDADGQADGATVSAPMPGKVVKALVKEGDEVEKGQGVIVVEAMKMENELKSHVAGKVKLIAVENGENVDAGQQLVVIE